MQDFESVQNALEWPGATADASETHGTLCGLLPGNSIMALWLAHSQDSVPEQLQILKRLFEQTIEDINIEDVSLELLYPKISH